LRNALSFPRWCGFVITSVQKRSKPPNRAAVPFKFYLFCRAVRPDVPPNEAINQYSRPVGRLMLRFESGSSFLETCSRHFESRSALLELFSRLLETCSALLEVFSRLFETLSALLELFSRLFETRSTFLETCSRLFEGCSSVAPSRLHRVVE